MALKAPRLFGCFPIIFAALILATPCQAGVDAEVSTALKTPAAPLDIAASLDGKWTYVLAEGGKLFIYSDKGTLEDTVTVDPAMDHIASSGLQAANIPDRVYLASSKNKTIQTVALDFSVPINIQGAPFLGPENAPVVVVAFSDFECPYCGTVGGLFGEILAKHPKEVKVVFKQFPLAMHKQAQSAALASLAAHRQGKFWQYHDLLFENQKSLSDAKYNELAKKLGLDLDRFNKDYKAPVSRQALERDMADAQIAGVRGTPTIFVNGRRLKERNIRDLQQMVTQELSKRSKGGASR
ncbi:DsbA family protein [Thiovibrio frasassiensis]|uniref:Thioredoxin domain-containing protein n=1 Tax=Thiovibrio frasassiensis TaxID=2984131 RepID=A0A9X4RNU2_9BACT|nr:thioredoxin domain-containing protein [Thiovibrio frasassiensis]MDG4474577.1 thioredoxin domain-containing protein [Thiovibrio frasassiensis]